LTLLYSELMLDLKKLFITAGSTHKLSLQPDETKIMIFFNGNFANVDNITILIDLNNYSNQNNMPPPLEYLLTSLPTQWSNFLVYFLTHP
jgi:hypothetical protein